jgi:hypothetical protein
MSLARPSRAAVDLHLDLDLHRRCANHLGSDVLSASANVNLTAIDP